MRGVYSLQSTVSTFLFFIFFYSNDTEDIVEFTTKLQNYGFLVLNKQS